MKKKIDICENYVSNNVIYLFTNIDYSLEFVNNYYGTNYEKVMNINDVIKKYNTDKFHISLSSGFNCSHKYFNFLLQIHFSNLSFRLLFYKRIPPELFFQTVDEYLLNITTQISLIGNIFIKKFLDKHDMDCFTMTEFKKWVYLSNVKILDFPDETIDLFKKYYKSIEIKLTGTKKLIIQKGVSETTYRREFYRSRTNFDLQDENHIEILLSILKTKSRIDNFITKMEKTLLC